MSINREATIRWKGYDPADLKPQSHKKVWAVCEDCDKGRWTIFHLYRPVCASCAAKKKEFSPEHRKNISIAKTGIPHSEETKSLMSTLKIQFHIDNPDAGTSIATPRDIELASWADDAHYVHPHD